MKAKTSIAFDSLSGSAGNVTAARTNAGLSLRTKSTPTNPKTQYQGEIRSIFSAQTKAWAEQTEENRKQWNAIAPSYSGKKSFGISAKLSGFNAFVRINSNLSLIGKSTLKIPPVATEFPKVTLIGLAYSLDPTISGHKDGGLVVMIDSPMELKDMTAIVRLTPQLSNGITSKMSALRIIDKTATVEKITGEDMEENPISCYGIKTGDKWKTRFNVPSGDYYKYKIGVEIYLIDNKTGFSSGKIQNTFITTAINTVTNP